MTVSMATAMEASWKCQTQAWVAIRSSGEIGLGVFIAHLFGQREAWMTMRARPSFSNIMPIQSLFAVMAGITWDISQDPVWS